MRISKVTLLEKIKSILSVQVENEKLERAKLQSLHASGLAQHQKNFLR